MTGLDAVRARFARNEGLPFADVLTEANVLDVLNDHGVKYWDRVFNPVTTIWGFLSQVLSDDQSCRDALSRIIAHRAANGEALCSPNTASYVIDYGTYPDQQRPYFTLRDARLTLALATKVSGLEGQIYAGLEALTRDLLNRPWKRDDGAGLRIERCLIDANWGQSTDVVYQFCRHSTHGTVVMPSHGKFVSALGISARHLWQLTKDGNVPCVRVGSGTRKTVLYPVAELQAWLVRQTAKAEGSEQ